ncbi:MAG: hypothetical protein KC729_19235, partial [Candidatus Eisenbacteria bacterium]|nr:hypothetical protein [Candidatus Eisenbacteria bacterium]
VVWFAVAPNLLYYATEFKQYGVAVFATAVLVWLAVEVARDHSRGSWITLIIVGLVALFFSNSSIFVLGAVGIYLLIDGTRRFGAAAAVRPIMAGSIWLAGFAWEYWLLLRPLHANSWLHEYWSDGLYHGSLTSPLLVPWLALRSIAMVGTPFDFGHMELGARTVAMALLLLLLGITAAWRRPHARLLLALPFVFVELAALLGWYPAGGRLVLFLSPLLLLLVGNGSSVLIEALRSRGWWIGLAGVVAVFFVPTVDAVRLVMDPPKKEELPTVMDQILEKAESGDRIYVYHSALPAWDFYARRDSLKTGEESLRWSDFAIVRGDDVQQSLVALAEEVDRIAAKPGRVWIVFSHRVPVRSCDPDVLIQELLSGRGEELDTLGAPGADAILFRIRGSSPHEEHGLGPSLLRGDPEVLVEAPLALPPPGWRAPSASPHPSLADSVAGSRVAP